MVNQTENLEIWAVIDDKPGHRNQVIGVVEALGLPYKIKKLIFNKNASKPNFLKGNNLKTLDLKASDTLGAPWPDIIISAGRRSVPVVNYIKKQAKKAGKKAFACHIMWPSIPYSKFDLIAVPAHDKLPKLLKNSGKILRTDGAPNMVNNNFLKQEYNIWNRTLGDLAKPRIVVLLGGNSKKVQLNIDDANIISRHLIRMMNLYNGSVYICSSRRTPEEVNDIIFHETKRKIGLNIFNFNYNEAKSKANPYYALLEAADIIITTADSISMCSEACSTGKPVLVYQPSFFNSKKHKNFVRNLLDKNFALNLDSKSIKLLNSNYIRNYSSTRHYVNPAKQVADEIMRRINLLNK